MNYEEKYKKALETANAKIETYYHLGNTSVAKSIEEIFPELKENEDEKIRKELIKLMKQMSNTIVENYTTIEISTFVAWLEKQGEQKPVEWSAYDKATLEYIIEDIKELCDNETEEGSIETYNREINLLQAINESIKLSSYTNPAVWSEEDERIQQCLIEDQERGLEAVINSKVGHSEIISDLKEMYHERLDWLKSLKERFKETKRRVQLR